MRFICAVLCLMRMWRMWLASARRETNDLVRQWRMGRLLWGAGSAIHVWAASRTQSIHDMSVAHVKDVDCDMSPFCGRRAPHRARLSHLLQTPWSAAYALLDHHFVFEYPVPGCITPSLDTFSNFLDLTLSSIQITICLSLILTTPCTRATMKINTMDNASSKHSVHPVRLQLNGKGSIVHWIHCWISSFHFTFWDT